MVCASLKAGMTTSTRACRQSSLGVADGAIGVLRQARQAQRRVRSENEIRVCSHFSFVFPLVLIRMSNGTASCAYRHNSVKCLGFLGIAVHVPERAPDGVARREREVARFEVFWSRPEISLTDLTRGHWLTRSILSPEASGAVASEVRRWTSGDRLLSASSVVVGEEIRCERDRRPGKGRVPLGRCAPGSTWPRLKLSQRRSPHGTFGNAGRREAMTTAPILNVLKSSLQSCVSQEIVETVIVRGWHSKKRQQRAIVPFGGGEAAAEKLAQVVTGQVAVEETSGRRDPEGIVLLHQRVEELVGHLLPTFARRSRDASASEAIRAGPRVQWLNP